MSATSHESQDGGWRTRAEGRAGNGPLRLLLAENAPALNRGEAAILRGLATAFSHTLGAFDLLLLSSDPVNDEREYADVCRVQPNLDATSSRMRRRLPRRAQAGIDALRVALAGVATRAVGNAGATEMLGNPVLRAYAGADVILVAHDNFAVGPHLAPQILAKVVMARAAGKKCVLCGGSFGPFEPGVHEALAKLVLHGCDAVVLREPSSYRYCQQLIGKSSKPRLGADPAFLMNPVKARDLSPAGLSAMQWARGAVGFAVSAGSLVDASAFSTTGQELAPRERRQLHVEAMIDVVDRVATTIDRRVVLVAHSLARGDDDLEVAVEIARNVTRHVDVMVLDPTLSAPETKTVLGALDLLVSERVHAAIAAVSQHVPVLVLTRPGDYRAFGIFSEMLGLPAALYDVSDLAADKLAEHVLTCWAGRAAVREALSRAVPAVVAQAEEVGRAVASVVAVGCNQ